MPGAGGRLVVVERSGRLGKQFPLAQGLATLGKGAACDVRLLLPHARPHHATLALHKLQAVIRNVSDGETFVNGKSISVAALRHNDVITIGDRSLRWEYDDPTVKRPAALETVAPGGRGAGRGRVSRRQTAAGQPAQRPRGLQLTLELQHRASMPGGAGGKQVAIVQPQRRDTSERQNESAPPAPESPRPLRGVSAEGAQSMPSQAPTKATLWIESRKSAPRRSAPLPSTRKHTPLRMAVLRRGATGRASAPPNRARVAKIEAPSEIDHTKQAAIMLMTGHAARARPLPSPSPSPSPAPPSPSSRRSTRGAARDSVSILEISESDPAGTPLPSSPRKSALRNPADRSRKAESIKFDLSNLSEGTLGPSEDDLTLRYSDASAKSPSPRRAIHSRSSRILEKLGASLNETVGSERRSKTLESPRKSVRGSLMLDKVLGESRRSASSLGPSPRRMGPSPTSRTRSLSPRSTTRNLESFSIVDLVSIDSTETSIYDSVGSTRSSSVVFGTPRPSAGRRTRSTIEPALLGSSTPYGDRANRSHSSPVLSSAKKSSPNKSRISIVSTRSKSLTTPENTRQLSVNSTRISRTSRSRSRINDSDLHMMSSKLDMDTTEGSPKSSRISRANRTLNSGKQNYSHDDTHVTTILADSSQEGTLTPENRQSPETPGTPVLSIQSLLNSSQSSFSSELSQRKNRLTRSLKRKTISVIRPASKKSRSSIKSKSLVISTRKSNRSTRSSPQDENTLPNDNEEIVTPKSSVKLVQEAVKNKHSTAKKPQSKRSIIDDLNESDIVKQLFNSPVKRKLSQSMTEFSRRHLFDDDVVPKRPTRNTMAGTGRTVEHSLSDGTGEITPELFVSPLGTPSGSPDLAGVKRLFQRTSPANDLRNVRGVKRLLRTPRKSVRNDLTDVFGVKAIFAKSPANRLSDVRVKEAFAAGPQDDLRDVRGVRSLFRRSPADDLRDVSGVRRALRGSPRNDLRDVSGVAELFRDDDSIGLLLGGPSRAVASKSFPARRPPRSESRRVKSFRRDDAIAVDVASWPRPRAARELQKLATATVEGSAPLRSSRARDSTAGGTRRSEHTLPFKKRSLEPPRSPLAAPLPLKKRSVLHSTPLKGRRGPDMDGSDLGRVSPILGRVSHSFRAQQHRLGDASILKGRREAQVVVVKIRSPEKLLKTPRTKAGRTAKANISVNTNQPGNVSLKSPRTATRRTAEVGGDAGTKGRKSKARAIQTQNSAQKTPVESQALRAGSTADEAPPQRGRRAPRAKDAVDTKKESLEKPSPKRTRGSKVRAEPPQPAKTTRSKQAKVETTTEVLNTKRRRKSLVITKKPPVMSPQPAARSTRRKAVAESPKNTRAKIVVTKSSPKLKPRPAKTRGAKETDSPPARPRTTRRPKGAAQESLKKTPTPPKRKGGRRNASATEIAPEPKRSRKTLKSEASSESQAGRGRSTRRTKVEAQTSVNDPPKSRGKKVAAQNTVEKQSTTGKKKVAQDSIETRNKKRQKAGAQESVETEKVQSTRSSRAGRKRKSAEEPVATPAKVAKSEPAKAPRGRRAKKEEDPEGRKTLAQEKAETVRSSRRGDRGHKSPKAAKEPAPKKAATQEDENTTRGRKTRGQAQAQATAAAAPAAATRSRRGRR